jgi:hypothetical protein
MKATLYNWNAGEERKLWKNALVVFDSTSLLNFYDYSEAARNDIYTTVFKPLKGRLWMTNRTEYEFLKNREKVIKGTQKLYAELKEQSFPSVHFKKFSNQYDQLKARTKKGSKHPYFASEIFKKLDSAVSSVHSEIKALEVALDKEITARTKDTDLLLKNDNIHASLFGFFNVSDGYTFKELMRIVEEGELRYRNKIPPGYKDDAGKVGLSKYGDLIIWKQLIDLAQKHKQPVILITDDLKEDWYYSDKNKEIVAPREELVKEMLDSGGVHFWSYSTAQFLQKANSILGVSLKEGVIKEVDQVGKQSFFRGIEEMVYRWAKKRWKEDEVSKSEDYWTKDSGVDFIVAIDGVAFASIIKYLKRTPTISEVRIMIQEAESYANFNYESVNYVFVCDDRDVALSTKKLLENNFPDSYQIVGTINGLNEFEPV